MNKAAARLGRGSSVLFVCDIQDKFRPVIHNMERLIANAKFLKEATSVMVEHLQLLHIEFNL